MTAAPTTVPAGQAVAYTITVTNNADTDTASFKPTDDDLPAANVVADDGRPRAHGVPVADRARGLVAATSRRRAAAGRCSARLPSLPAGAAATFTLTVALADCAAHDGSAITASANVTSSTADPNPAPNNAASAAVAGLERAARDQRRTARSTPPSSARPRSSIRAPPRRTPARGRSR